MKIRAKIIELVAPFSLLLSLFQLINRSLPLALKLFWVTSYCLFFEFTEYERIDFSMVKLTL